MNAKVGNKDIFKQAISNESLYEISNDIESIAVNFSTTKNLAVKKYNDSTLQHSEICLDASR
jgi:hypothetical protein